MPRRPARSRRLITSALWPLGIGLTSWHYMWRTTPLHRREESDTEAERSPPALPPEVSGDDVQPADDGVGPLFHRCYRARIRGANLGPEALMALVSADPDRAAPTEFARFHKVLGEEDEMRVGDEFVVRMPGPWDGPVRVVSITPTSFRLATLKGHRALNFDVDRRPELTLERGWKSDEYCQRLASEPPGAPVAGGTWEVARRLMRDYEFADPKIVRSVYHPEQPLEQREMLLEARFWGLRFRLGVRIGGVTDETREIDGRQVRVWGWNYRTLQGHMEMGQMDYEVWKWLDSGDVEFRIFVLSRQARVANPVFRLGLRLFGRREQVKFARHACDRMARLTAA